ncbi:unnamed protein product [Phytomonas sp. EM1]|nr:unnamed protein product [Phytomonas sp. EM1]|eukprot:CCW61327.1 unnamed protein product [Phytomonas sp. isolate EM1]
MSAASVRSGNSRLLNSTSSIKQVPTGTINANSSPPPIPPWPQAMGSGIHGGGVAPPIGSKVAPQHPPLGSAIVHGGSGSTPPPFFAKSVPPAGGPTNWPPAQPPGPFLGGKKMMALNQLPFPPNMMNVKGGKIIVQSPQLPMPHAPSKSVGGQKGIVWAPVSGDAHMKRPPGILQPPHSQQLHTSSALTTLTDRGTTSLLGFDSRNMSVDGSNSQTQFPPKRSGGVSFPPPPNPFPNDSASKAAHLVSSNKAPSEVSSQSSHIVPPSLARGKAHFPLSISDELVISVPKRNGMSPERSSMQSIASSGQSGGKQPGSSSIPNQPPAVPELVPMGLELKPSTAPGVRKDSPEILFPVQNPQKTLLQQPAGRVGTDPVVGSNSTGLVQGVSGSTAPDEGSLETNQTKEEPLPKPPIRIRTQKPSRFAHLLIDSDDDTDEDVPSEGKNENTGGDGAGAGEEAHSGADALPNEVVEGPLAAVADELPQTGDAIDAKETDHEVAVEVVATEGEDRMLSTVNDSPHFRELEIPVEPREPPVVAVESVDQPKISTPERPPPSISSTSRPPSGSKSGSNSRVSDRLRSKSADVSSDSTKAGKRNFSDAVRPSLVSKRKNTVSTVPTRTNKGIAPPRRKDPKRFNSQTKPSAVHSSSSVLSNIDGSENTVEQREKDTAAAKSGQPVKHPQNQRKSIESSRTSSEKFDDLAADELVSSTTLLSDEGIKEKALSRRRSSPLSNFKSSDLYHLYHMLKELESGKAAERVSLGRVQRKSKTPLNSFHISTRSRGRTPSNHKHRSSFAGSDNNDDENWEQRGRFSHNRWSEYDSHPQGQETPQRGSSERPPWRCGAKATVSNSFASPSPVRRPFGYINIGGGFYERVGYSPYAQRRLRHSTSPEEPPIYPGVDVRDAPRGVPKNGDVWQIMREQGQAAVRAAQSDPLHQSVSSRRVGAGAGDASSVSFLDLPSQEQSPRDWGRFHPLDVKFNRGSYVEEIPVQGHCDSPYHYCTSVRPARQLISPSPLADDVCGSAAADPVTYAEHISNRYASPDLIRDAGKALDRFLKRASKQQPQSSNTDLCSDDKRAGDSSNNVHSGGKTHLQGEGYTKLTSPLPGNSRKKSLHSYEGGSPVSLPRDGSTQHRCYKDSDEDTRIKPSGRARGAEGEGMPLEEITGDDRAQHLRNYPRSRNKKESRNMDYGMSSRSSLLHLETARDAAEIDSFCQPMDKIRPDMHIAGHCDSRDAGAKCSSRIGAAERQAFLQGKPSATSSSLFKRPQKGHLDAAASVLVGQHDTTRAIDSFMHPIEVAKGRFISPEGSTALPERDLRGKNHPVNLKATLKKTSSSSTASSAVELRAKSIPGSKKRAASTSVARVTPTATANIQRSPFSHIASRTTRRKGNLGYNKVELCSEWVDEVLSSVVHRKGSPRADVSKVDSSLGRGSAAKAAQSTDIPLIDMRREFRPITSEDLAKVSPSLGGHLSTRSRNSMLNGRVGSVDDSVLRPHIPTIHFKTMNGVRTAHSVSNHSAGNQSLREKSTSTNGNLRKTSDKTRQVVVNVPNGMPYEAYSTIKVKNPQQPSPWARAPSARGGVAELPGRPAARRVLSIPPPTETEDSETQRTTKTGNAVATSSDKVGYRLVQELHLDEYRRPYIIIKEVPTGALAREQRQSVERLSKPKPVFVRPEESQK